MGRPTVIFLILVFATLSASAISRSGGGKLESVELGFSAETPEPYMRPHPLVNNGIRLWSDFMLGGGVGVSAESFIELRPIESEFPELAKATRKNTRDLFASISWLPETHADSCIDVYKRRSTTVTSIAVMWGPGRGVVILGGLSRVATNALDEIVMTLKLAPGACGW